MKASITITGVLVCIAIVTVVIIAIPRTSADQATDTPKEASSKQPAPLLVNLTPPVVQPAVLNQQFNARQRDGGSDFIRELDATRRDPARTWVERNYAVQHLTLAYENSGQPAALAALAEAQDDADPRVADTAIFNLARLIYSKALTADGPEAASLHLHLRAALDDDRKGGLREGAIRAIALLEDKAYAPRLAELAGTLTSDVAVRVAALDALAALGCTEYRQLGQAVLAEAKAGSVLSVAARRLAALGG